MVYPIVKYGDPVLEREADTVTEFGTPELDKFLEDMFESMYAAKGVGLAAPQIGFGRKIAELLTAFGEGVGGEKLIGVRLLAECGNLAQLVLTQREEIALEF